MKSKFLSLEKKDAIKALITAVLIPVMDLAMITLNSGSLEFDWKRIGGIAIASALGYILKNWLTNSDDKFLMKE